jgi:hypothetical protein
VSRYIVDRDNLPFMGLRVLFASSDWIVSELQGCKMAVGELVTKKFGRSMRFLEVFGLWAAAIVGLIAIHASTSDSRDQRVLMQAQIAEMRAEQRPILWVKSDLGAPVYYENVHQIIWTVHLTNYGKNMVSDGAAHTSMLLDGLESAPEGKPDRTDVGPVAPSQDITISVVSGPGISAEQWNSLLTRTGGIRIKLAIEFGELSGARFRSIICLARTNAGSISFCPGVGKVEELSPGDAGVPSDAVSTSRADRRDSVDWGSIPDWLVAAGTAATALFAWRALTAWRTQLRSETRHAAAAEIAEAVGRLKLHFYDARSPFIGAWEFDKKYQELEQPTNADKAEAYAHVYNTRWQHVHPELKNVATLMAKATALLGEPQSGAMDKLIKTASGLSSAYQERVEQLRAGPDIIAQWADQDWVRYVQKSVEVFEERDDKLSADFERDFHALIALLNIDLAI